MLLKGKEESRIFDAVISYFISVVNMASPRLPLETNIPIMSTVLFSFFY